MILTKHQLQKIAQHQAVHKAGENLLEAAVAIILREGVNGTEFLLMQRAYHPNDPWSGQMGFPGGKLEGSDTSKIETAIRETYEEVGIELTDADYLGQLNDIYGMRANQQLNVHVACFVFKVDRPITPKGNHEVADLVWLPMSYLDDPQNAFEYYHPMDQSLLMPAVLINQAKEQILWGLSLRMLIMFYELVGSPIGALKDQLNDEDINN